MAAFYTEKSLEPGLVAQQEADAADAELQARWRADRPAQERRLRSAGWRQAFETGCGAGGWGHLEKNLQLIHTVSRFEDGNLWAHMSLAVHASEELPGWGMLRDAHWLLYPGLPAVQVIVPPSRHVNIGEVAHAWTCLAGSVLPDFGKYGTI